METRSSSSEERDSAKKGYTGYTFFLEQEKKRETEIISAFAYCRQQTKEKQGVPWHWLLRMTAHKLGKSKTNGKSSEEYQLELCFSDVP